MGNNKELEQLREAMRFEEQQLRHIRAVSEGKTLTPVQQANWPALVASHERAIALYASRISDLEGK